MQILDSNSKLAKEDHSSGNEMLQETPRNFIKRPHITNEEVRNTINQHISQYYDLLTMIKKKKMKWYGHVTRSDGLAKTVIQGTVQGKRKTEEEMGRQHQQMAGE